MDKRNLPIGIFDSGVGGLTVLKEVRKILPGEDIIYLGDTAHLPYGTKSKSAIIKLSISNILFLMEKRVKIVILACNSTSSVALPVIRNFFAVPILGVVEAGVEAALEKGVERIGIIGTPATVKSRSYQKLIKQKNPKARIIAQSCPLFVPLVEEGWINSSITQQVVEFYLKKLNGRVDLLILACTHYPLLKKNISRALKGICLIDSAQAVARKSEQILRSNNLHNDKAKGKLSFFVTDYSPNFSNLAKLILKKKIIPTIVETI